MKTKIERNKINDKRKNNGLIESSAHKKTEEALRNSEERYRSLVELSPDGLIVHNEGKFVYANSSALRIYGAKTFEQLREKKITDYIHPDDRTSIEARMQQGYSGQQIPLQETRLLRLDGEFLHVETIGSRIDYEGKPSVQIIIRDITERKKKEKELDRLNQLLRAHNKSSHAMIHAKDELSYLNEICQIVVKDCGQSMVWIGYSEENEDKSVKPMAYAGFEKGYLEKLKISWADNEYGRGPTGTAIRTGKLCECRNMLTDPKFKQWREEATKRGYASSIALPLLNKGKKLGAITIYSKESEFFAEDEKDLFIELAKDLSYGIVAIRTQIERDKAEEELFETKNYLENLINYANAPIIVWDAESKIRLFNKAFEFLTGYSHEEAIGKKLDFLFPKESIKDTHEKIEQTLSGDYWKSIEIPILCKNNETRIVLWNSANIYDVDCQTLISTIAQGNDITEMKKAEEKLEKYASDLKELNATKDKFFGIIAHDLKNPFSSILVASELLYSEPDKFEPAKIELFSKILRDAAKSAYALLENLLEWSRTQTGNIEFNPQNVNITELISNNLTQVKVYATNKNIKLLSNVIDDVHIFADKNMLNTVIRNLLNNAVKFTNKGGKVVVDAKLSNKVITLSVKDNGIGIPKKDIDKLFRIDTKYTNIGTANERGTGLGLLLCKEFVEKHGGQIWVESQIGKGSEFKFTIPLKNQ